MPTLLLALLLAAILAPAAGAQTLSSRERAIARRIPVQRLTHRRVWAIAIVILYLACRWFAGLKARRTEAWLRFV